MNCQFIVVFAIVSAPCSALNSSNPNLADGLSSRITVFWDFSEKADVWNIDQDVSIMEFGDATYVALWAWFKDMKHGMYMGLQDLGGSKRKAIFSIWNARAAQPGSGHGQQCTHFGNEGSGYSCHIDPFPVKTGTDSNPYMYKYRIWRLDKDPSGGYWWGAWIIDQGTGTEYYLGKLLSDQSFVVMNQLQNFFEYFGDVHQNCDAVPQTRGFVTQPAVNQRLGHSSYSSSGRGSCTGGKAAPTTISGWSGVLVNFGGPRLGMANTTLMV